MANRVKRLLSKVLAGVSFVAVIAIAGCSSSPLAFFGNKSSVATSSALKSTEPAVSQSTVMAEAMTEVSTPRANVFGEFDGNERPIPVAGSAAGFRQHTSTDEGFDTDIAIDAQGTWMVFSSTRHSLTSDIYMQRVEGMSVTQLTSDPADDVQPAFSPDNKSIAFASNRAGNWDIYVMDADGKNVMQVTNSSAQDLHPSFAPDGTRIVYCSLGTRSNQWELWVVDLRTNQKKMIGFGLFPSWSPDKSRDQIAFQRARQRGSRWFSLWTLDLVDGEATRVTEVAASGNAAIVSPRWSPDGKRLTFATIVDPAQTVAGKPRGQQDVWVINADGTGRQRITDGTGVNATPFWAADGRIYFVSDRSGTETVWSAHSQGLPVVARKQSEEKQTEAKISE